MPTFHCKIGTSDGRVVEKEFEAASRVLLRENLEEQGFHVFAIKARPFQFLRDKPGGGGRLTGRRFLTFNQELLVLIRSGLPILQVLDTIIERLEPGGMLDILRQIRQDVRGGSALSEAFGKFPRAFPHLYIASIRAGERTGDLPVTLARFIAYQKRVEAIYRRYIATGAYQAWARTFGRECPEPDFIAAQSFWQRRIATWSGQIVGKAARHPWLIAIAAAAGAFCAVMSFRAEGDGAAQASAAQTASSGRWYFSESATSGLRP